MEIKTNKDDEMLTISIAGRLDTVSSQQLEKCVKDALFEIKKLVFDMKELEYISSAGLRVLLATQKVMNKQGVMIIKNANSDIMDIFEVTGFVDIFTIEN